MQFVMRVGVEVKAMARSRHFAGLRKSGNASTACVTNRIPPPGEMTYCWERVGSAVQILHRVKPSLVDAHARRRAGSLCQQISQRHLSDSHAYIHVVLPSPAVLARLRKAEGFRSNPPLAFGRSVPALGPTKRRSNSAGRTVGWYRSRLARMPPGLVCRYWKDPWTALLDGAPPARKV